MKKTIHRGVISIEVMVVLFIVMLAIIIGLPRYNQYMQELEWHTDARQLTAVAAASKSYIRDNRDTLINKVSGGTPVQLTGAQLLSAGYLPEGFSLKNSAAQTYLLGIARNPKSIQKLVAFVLTQGGTDIAFRGQRYISQAVEGAGGYIHTAGIAEGAWGSWKMTLSAYGLSGTAGRLAVYLSSEVLGTDTAESDRLYRYAVNGRPDLNRMHTAIDMNANDINNGGTLNGKKGVFSDTLTAGSDIKSTGGWLVTSNSKGWMNDTHGGGFYMSDNDWIRSVNNKGIYTAGQIKGGTVRSDGRLSAGEYLELDGVATAGNACSGRLVGLDRTNNLLTCQNQRWQSLSGGTYSRTATGSLAMSAPGAYKNVLVTVSSLFNGKDGSHTAYANFIVKLNGKQIGTVSNQVVVHKGGSKGHSWIYQSYAVAQRMFTVPVSTGNQLVVTLASSNFHVSSDIRVDLTD